MKIFEDISNSNMLDTFKKYFENMYPDISTIIDEWNFEINIAPKIKGNEDGLKSDIDAVSDFTTDEISDIFENNGSNATKEQWTAITNLNKVA